MDHSTEFALIVLVQQSLASLRQSQRRVAEHVLSEPQGGEVVARGQPTHQLPDQAGFG